MTMLQGMSKGNPSFNERRVPLAYFISFRSYATWLHGDSRGSVDRWHNTYGTPFLPSDEKLEAEKRRLLKYTPATLDAERRRAVEQAVRETCQIRHWLLRAINVRTKQVHAVVTAGCKPEWVMNAFKANATRQMVAEGIWRKGRRPWARHGSTRWLWTEGSIGRACDYVLNGQGEALPDFEESED